MGQMSSETYPWIFIGGINHSVLENQGGQSKTLGKNREKINQGEWHEV